MDEKETATAISAMQTTLGMVAEQLARVATGQERTSGQVADLRVLIEEKTGDLPTRHDVEAMVATRLAVDVWRSEKEGLQAQLAELKGALTRVYAVMTGIALLELSIFSAAMAYLMNVRK